MTQGIDIPHPLKREGTYQAERFPIALRPEYILLDERSIADLVKQTAEYAAFVKYTNEINQADGNWTSFLEELYDYSSGKVRFETLAELEEKASVSPHLALFLAFLRLFQIEQDSLNSLTRKHLLFYYQHILHFSPSPEIPDKAVLIFDPEKQADEVMVKAGTPISGGKDPDGKALIYETNNDLVVNKARVEKISTFFVSRNSNRLNGVYALPNARLLNAATGLPLLFSAFGTTGSPAADVGFALSSPVLNITEGKRRVTFFINGIHGIPSHALKVEFTSPDGWEEAIIKTSQTGYRQYLLAVLEPGHKPVVPYNESVHHAGMDTTHPVARFTLRSHTGNDAAMDFLYRKFRELRIDGTEITVQVNGARGLLLQNDTGKLDSSKPFHPFGTMPAKAKSAFYIGNPFIFNKYLKAFSLGINWKNLPGNLVKYYKEYNLAADLTDATYFEKQGYKLADQFKDFAPGHPPGKLSVLSQGEWSEIELNKYGGYKAHNYYDPFLNKNKTRAYHRNVYKPGSASGEITDEFSYNQPDKFDHRAKSGFVRIELGYDFGHTRYQWLQMSMMTKVQQGSTGIPILKQPYTPEFNSLSVDYTLSTAIDSDAVPENRFFHIHPFGAEAIEDSHAALVPALDDEGNLLIGLSGIRYPQSVCLYFDLHDNTGNPDALVDQARKPLFSYLTGNTWKPFDQSCIIQDTTQHFTGPGIIGFAIPSEAITPHTILADNLVWLKISVPDGSDAFPLLNDIHAQAVYASFRNAGNQTVHLEKGAPPGTIIKPVIKISGIRSISQPYITRGGFPAESQDHYITRVSEILRHKGRAWSIWDYERMILQNFPDVIKAKCISHSNSHSEFVPGQVLIVLLPDINRLPQNNILQPRVNRRLRNEILEYVTKYGSPFVTPEVINPVYETISILCNFKLRKGYNDENYYRNKLSNDIDQFLSPWVREYARLPQFEGRFYKSQIINFIEELPYIDYITRLEAVKEDGTLYDELISGSRQSVILTSSGIHNLSTNVLC